MWCVQSTDQGPAVRPVVNVDSGSLEDLITLINRSTAPTTFDLCGRRVCSTCADDTFAIETVITAPNVSIKNGTLWLADGPSDPGPSLAVSGSGFEMEGVTVLGGKVGLRVDPGGVATLWGCTMQGMDVGVMTMGKNQPQHKQPKLTAHNLRVLGCKGCGVSVMNYTSSVHLTDCLVTGCAGNCAIDVVGELVATRLRCVDNAGFGVELADGNLVGTLLTDCTVTGNKGDGVVVNQGSNVKLVGCLLDGVLPGANPQYQIVVTLSGKVRSSDGQVYEPMCEPESDFNSGFHWYGQSQGFSGTHV